MSQPPFTAFSKPTTLGVVLLSLSATLFAADVGGTYALDGIETPGTPLPPAAQAPTVSAAMPAAVAPDAVASDAVPTDTTVRASVVLVDPRLSTTVHAASWHLMTPPRSRPHAIVAKTHVAATVLARTVPIVISRSRPHVVAALPRAYAALAGRKTVAVHVAVRRRAAVVAFAPPPARVRSAEDGAHRVADLRDVRRFVMKKLAAKYHGFSVISASAYSNGGNVRVNLVVRDHNREWFENDLVRRAGTKLAISAEKQRPLPHTEARGAPLVIPHDGSAFVMAVEGG
jgi:hypothetical protein